MRQVQSTGTFIEKTNYKTKGAEHRNIFNQYHL